MPLTIDSSTVFRAFADHPDAFPALTADISETARKLLLKQIKAKSMNADLLRRIRSVTSEACIAWILDSFALNELAGVIKKVDPHSMQARTLAGAQEGRRHILGLASGIISESPEPEKVAKVKAPKAPKATKATGEGQSKIGGLLQSKVHSGGPRPSRAKKVP